MCGKVRNSQSDNTILTSRVWDWCQGLGWQSRVRYDSCKMEAGMGKSQ